MTSPNNKVNRRLSQIDNVSRIADKRRYDSVPVHKKMTNSYYKKHTEQRKQQIESLNTKNLIPLEDKSKDKDKKEKKDKDKIRKDKDKIQESNSDKKLSGDSQVNSSLLEKINKNDKNIESKQLLLHKAQTMKESAMLNDQDLMLLQQQEHKVEIQSLKSDRQMAQEKYEDLKLKFAKETRNNKMVKLPALEQFIINNETANNLFNKLKDKYLGSNMNRTQKNWIRSNIRQSNSPAQQDLIHTNRSRDSSVIKSLLRDSVQGNQGFAKSHEIERDNETFNQQFYRKKVDLDPSFRNTQTNLSSSNKVQKTNVNKSVDTNLVEMTKDNFPLQYLQLPSNNLSKINFSVLNIWYLNYNSNFSRYKEMKVMDRQHKIKSFVNNLEQIKNEIAPVFNNLDQDGSGQIEQKEYKMTRFLIEGQINSKKLKEEFLQMDLDKTGKINFNNFYKLYIMFFNDAIKIMDLDIYSIYE